MQIEEAFVFAEELVVLKYFPAGAVALGKVAELIAEVCPTAEDARQVVDEMVRSYEEWPGPSHIRTVRQAIVVREKPPWDPNAPKCQECDGTGWMPSVGSHGEPGVVPCKCHALCGKGAA
jgi:hypothetical protein